MDTPQTERPPQTECFKFNIHTFPDPLERFSVSEWNTGEDALLKQKQYVRVAGGAEHIETYASTWTSDKYLVIVRVEQYRFIFYIPDDASLLEWKRQYEQIPPSFLVQKFLPPPRTAPEMVMIPMNIKALRQR